MYEMSESRTPGLLSWTRPHFSVFLGSEPLWAFASPAVKWGTLSQVRNIFLNQMIHNSVSVLLIRETPCDLGESTLEVESPVSRVGIRGQVVSYTVTWILCNWIQV